MYNNQRSFDVWVTRLILWYCRKLQSTGDANQWGLWEIVFLFVQCEVILFCSWSMIVFKSVTYCNVSVLDVSLLTTFVLLFVFFLFFIRFPFWLFCSFLLLLRTVGSYVLVWWFCFWFFILSLYVTNCVFRTGVQCTHRSLLFGLVVLFFLFYFCFCPCTLVQYVINCIFFTGVHNAFDSHGCCRVHFEYHLLHSSRDIISGYVYAKHDIFIYLSRLCFYIKHL